MVIYADMLLALNWWLDFLLLLGVGRVSHGVTRPWRLVLGALTGALCAGVILLPPLPWWLSLTVKGGGAALMVVVAFGFGGWRAFIRRTLWLFALSAGLAGLSSALYFFVAPTGFYVFNGVVYYAVPPLLLVMLTVICYGIMMLVERAIRHRAPAGQAYWLRLTVDGREAVVRCLYDSGNHLAEPFSGRPVMVVERRAVATLLPVPATVDALPAQSDVSWRLVPFASLGGEGLLPAFMPTGSAVKTAAGWRDMGPCYVAVCDRLGRGEYEGLLSSSLGEYIA